MDELNDEKVSELLNRDTFPAELLQDPELANAVIKMIADKVAGVTSVLDLEPVGVALQQIGGVLKPIAHAIGVAMSRASDFHAREAHRIARAHEMSLDQAIAIVGITTDKVTSALKGGSDSYGNHQGRRS